MSRFDRELQKLECSINYRKSNKKERSQINGWDMVAEIMKFVIFGLSFDGLEARCLTLLINKKDREEERDQNCINLSLGKGSGVVGLSCNF